VVLILNKDAMKKHYRQQELFRFNREKKHKKTTLEDIKGGFSLFPSPSRVSGKVLHVYLISIKSVFFRLLSRKICTPITPKKNKQAYNA